MTGINFYPRLSHVCHSCCTVILFIGFVAQSRELKQWGVLVVMCVCMIASPVCCWQVSAHANLAWVSDISPVCCWQVLAHANLAWVSDVSPVCCWQVLAHANLAWVSDVSPVCCWQVSAHANLAWVFSCLTSMSSLEHLPQWKVCDNNRQ